MDRTALAKEFVALAKTLIAENGIHYDVAEKLVKRNNVFKKFWADIDTQIEQIFKAAYMLDDTEDKGDYAGDERNAIVMEAKILEADLILASRQIDALVKALRLIKLDMEEDKE